MATSGLRFEHHPRPNARLQASRQRASGSPRWMSHMRNVTVPAVSTTTSSSSQGPAPAPRATAPYVPGYFSLSGARPSETYISEKRYAEWSVMETTDGRRDCVRQTLRMMRFVKPAEKETFLHDEERWMWPLKSEGSQMVISDVDAECTSSLNFVVRVGVNLRHCWRGVVRRARTIKATWRRTYHFDLHRCIRVCADVHA